MKCLFIIADGAGDRPIQELGNKTPFQAANTPNLDYLAELGETGLLDIISPGVRPGSDTAHLSLFGYDPKEYYTGRGPFEALGCGMELQPGDIAFRCNWGTLEEGKLVDRRAFRETLGLENLANTLNKMPLDNAVALFKQSTEHRASLILRGKGLSSFVSDTDPHENGVPVKKSMPRDNSEASKRTAKLLNDFTFNAENILSDHPINRKRIHPANTILSRGAGVLPELPSFKEKYNVRACCVAKEGMIIGVARSLGMKVFEPTDATGGLNENFDALKDSVLDAFEEGYDFVFLHLKGTDIAGHDGKPRAKVKYLEEADEMIGKIFKKLFFQDTMFVFTADHSTPCELKAHSGDPVPLVMAGKGLRFDPVDHFDETSVRLGSIMRIRALDLMPLIINAMNKSEKYGA